MILSKDVRLFNLENFEDAGELKKKKNNIIKKVPFSSDDSLDQIRNKKEFVLDLTGKIKTDDERIKELEKEHIEKLFKEADESKKKTELEAFETGKKKGFQMLVPSIDAFKSVILEMGKIRKAFYENAEKEMLSLVLNVSKSVINHELIINKDVVLNVIKKAVCNLIDQESIIIKINPEDFEYAVSCKTDIQAFASEINNIDIKSDNSIARGGCKIETNFGDIETKLDLNFTKIEEEFKGVL